MARGDSFRIVPLGDIHLGAAACDEERLKRTIDSIKNDPATYWIGMGDYCDFINRNDKRFNVATLADWVITKSALGDLAGAQKDRFLEMIAPIAPKCLALLEGNHETAIWHHNERNIYSDIVQGVKGAAQMNPEAPLALGYNGWITLVFYVGENVQSGGVETYRFNLHHGFTGGRLAGAKALNIQKWLWTHDADLVIFGHSHNTSIQIEAVERLDREGNVSYQKRIGCFSGTYLRTSADGADTYSEIKGYLPMPTSGVEIMIRPKAAQREDAIRVISV